MVNRLVFLKILIPCVFLLACAGCGEKYYPVSGTVTLDGKPFDNGSVTIIPEKGGPPAFGGTDGKGAFILENNNKSGVRAGTYKVTLQKFAPTKTNAKDLEKAERAGEFDSQPFSPVPEVFSKPESSPISITVPSADGKYLIDVKSK